MLAAGAFLLAQHLVSLPKRRYRKELAYRSGMAPFEDYVAEAEAGLAKENADWIFLFTVRSLPRGDFRWLRIVLDEETPSPAQVEVRVSSGKPWHFRRTAGNLPDASVQALRGAVKTLDLASLTSCPTLVRANTHRFFLYFSDTYACTRRLARYLPRKLFAQPSPTARASSSTFERSRCP
jgi:hypothetical protein